MEQATEQVASMKAALAILADKIQPGGWDRRLKLERPVRTMGVVMLDVDPKYLLQMPAPDEQQPIQARGADGPHPALRVHVCSWRPHWREEHLAALRAEHVIEPTGELRIPIMEQEAHPSPLVAQHQHQQQLRACWVTQSPLGLAVTPAKWTRRVSSSMKNSTYSRLSQTVSTVKQVAATIPAACWRRNARQVVAARRGAGSSRWRRRVVRIAVADTCTPSRISSPLIRWYPTGGSPPPAG
jgi:hypothetical protein